MGKQKTRHPDPETIWGCRFCGIRISAAPVRISVLGLECPNCGSAGVMEPRHG